MQIRSLVLASALLGATAAHAVDVVETTKETVTTYRGTVSQVVPGSSTIQFTAGASAQPVEYVYTEQTTFVDAAGNVVSREKIANQPVTVYYSGTGEDMMASKIVVTRPGERTVKETTTERRTTE